MSLGEVQAIYELLLKIDELLTGIESKNENLIRDMPKTREALTTYRDLERVTLRYLVLAKRMGLPEDVDNAIGYITRLVTVIRMAHISISLMMASNPVTAAMGIAGLATTVISSTDLLAGY